MLKWFKSLQFTLPQWRPKWRLPHMPLFSETFVSAWKKFIRQIPHEYRARLRSYQHFIILGPPGSGKTRLIQNFLEKNQELYLFETDYKQHPDVQFYLGSKQIIQEISFATLENRRAASKKQLSHLWRKLYAKREPIIVVVYDATKAAEMQKFAQFVAGKISLLSGISQKSLQVQLAMTHMDAIDGYLEFAQVLKEQNIRFHLQISADFENGALASQFKKFYEDHISFILTTVSAKDYLKIISFFKEAPLLFPQIEKFLRDLIGFVAYKKCIYLSNISLLSSEENSSLALFDQASTSKEAIFFQYTSLKHQLTSIALSVIGLFFLIGSYARSRNDLEHFKKAVSCLELFQTHQFSEEILPKLTPNRKKSYFSSLCFFQRDFKNTKTKLASQIWKHIIEREARKAFVEPNSEYKYPYFLALMHGTCSNKMGMFVARHAKKWSEVLHLEEPLVHLYLNCASVKENFFELHMSRVHHDLPLMNLNLWFEFLKKFQSILELPVIERDQYLEITKEANQFYSVIHQMRNDPVFFAIASLLEDKEVGQNRCLQTIRWIGSNIDGLEHFFLSLKSTELTSSEMQGMNLSHFFARIKGITQLLFSETSSQCFSFSNEILYLDSNRWNRLVVLQNIEEALHSYSSINRGADGTLFLPKNSDLNKQTAAIPGAVEESGTLQGGALNRSQTKQHNFNKLRDAGQNRLFDQERYTPCGPFFKTASPISPYYAKEYYELKVRAVAEKFVLLIESLSISPQEKQQFINFLSREVDCYVKNYKNYYVTFYNSFDLDCNSLESLKKILNDLTKPSSAFYDFLRSIQKQTHFLAESSNEFAFLDTILLDKEGEALLVQYQKLIEELSFALEKGIKETPAELSKNNEFKQLRVYLPTEQKISVDIAHNSPFSYLARARDLLTRGGVPERLQLPFLKPLLNLQQLGSVKIRDSIYLLWDTKLRSKIERVLSKFPFNPAAEMHADIGEVEGLLHPDSEFYQLVEQARIAYSYGDPSLEEQQDVFREMRDQLNRMSKLSALLWDPTGSPRPLTVYIRTIPLTTQTESGFTPTLSYLISGGQVIYNRNQTPSWQPLVLEWWKEGNYSVGIELFNNKTKNKGFRNLSQVKGLWGFFDLLKQGKKTNDHTWVWEIPSKDRQESSSVAFSFKTNPEELLQGSLSDE